MIGETNGGLIEMEIDWICSFCEERTQYDDDENRNFVSFLTPPHTALCAVSFGIFDNTRPNHNCTAQTNHLTTHNTYHVDLSRFTNCLPLRPSRRRLHYHYGKSKRRSRDGCSSDCINSVHGIRTLCGGCTGR